MFKSESQSENLIFVIDSLPKGGGTQKVVFQLSRALKHNYDITVISLNGGDESFIQELKKEGAHVIVFRKQTILFPGLIKLDNNRDPAMPNCLRSSS